MRTHGEVEGSARGGGKEAEGRSFWTQGLRGPGARLGIGIPRLKAADEPTDRQGWTRPLSGLA